MTSSFYGLSMDAVEKLISCEYAQQHFEGKDEILTAEWLKNCNLPVKSVHFPPGVIHRHGNVHGSQQRIAFNIISERLRPFAIESAHPAHREDRKVILVGIMMNAFQKDRDRYLRDAFRTSVANFKRRSPDAPFELVHFFFFGRAKGADFSAENATHGDVVVGDFAENMNDGKTFQMLNYTSRRRGDFVVKMDDDTTVRWSRLELLAGLHPPVYFGQFHQNIRWGLNGRLLGCCRSSSH